MRILSREEKRELKLSPLRKLRADLWDQGMSLEDFLDLCYSCDLNPLPMLRAKGINARYYKDTSYCDVSVSHKEDRVVLTYPDYESTWNEWTRFNDQYNHLLNLADELKQKKGLNRPHRVVRRKNTVLTKPIL